MSVFREIDPGQESICVVGSTVQFARSSERTVCSKSRSDAHDRDPLRVPGRQATVRQVFVNPTEAKNNWGVASIQFAFSIFVGAEIWLVPVEGRCRSLVRRPFFL